MLGEWFDATSSLMAFCKKSQADKRDVLIFQHTLVRLVSLLNATVLMELAAGSGLDKPETRAFELELIDAEGIDRESLMTINQTHDKVELIFQWIQQLIVESQCHQIFSVAPPVLSRSFQELATGMVRFHEAVKIAKIPFPFPYMQIMEVLLLFHWLITPFLTCMWVRSTFWAGVVTFMQIFFFWSLNAIACELENPFGEDVNDLPIQEMQLTMNRRLLLLLRPSTHRTARLSPQVCFDEDLGSHDKPRLGGRIAYSKTGILSPDPLSETEDISVSKRISLGALHLALEDQSGVTLEILEDADASGEETFARLDRRRGTEPVFKIREVVKPPPVFLSETQEATRGCNFEEKVLSRADDMEQSLQDMVALCREMRDHMAVRAILPGSAAEVWTMPLEKAILSESAAGEGMVLPPRPHSPCPVPEPGGAASSPRAAQQLGDVLSGAEHVWAPHMPQQRHPHYCDAACRDSGIT